MISDQISRQAVQDALRQWLQEFGEHPATLSTLVSLFRSNADRFYDLASIGLPTDTPAWAKDIAEVAETIRHFVRFGFRLDQETKQVIGKERNLYLGDAEFEVANDFLRQLSGTAPRTAAGRDYQGMEVSESEVRFNVGSSEEYKADKAQATARAELRPRVLQLDRQDLEAIGHGMPAYVIHELTQCAKRVVQAPTVIFQGIRPSGRLTSGRAYCGKPRRAFTNEGTPVPAPEGMVYCVYADAENFVFDWDWVKEDSTRSGYPKDYRARFLNPITELTEAVLIVPPDLKPAPFKKSKAWHSHRGDCMFFYISDDRAYANRVNGDLTEYRSIDSDELVGCKVKNFQEVLSKMYFSRTSVSVSAVLTASLVRQMDSHQQKEKTTFLKMIAQTALRMSEDRREEFFREVLALGDREDLHKLCDLVIKFTQDKADPVFKYVDRVVCDREAVERPYWPLIAAAGNTSVSTASGR